MVIRVFLCGLNRFQQIQTIEHFLQSFGDKDKDCEKNIVNPTQRKSQITEVSEDQYHDQDDRKLDTDSICSQSSASKSKNRSVISGSVSLLTEVGIMDDSIRIHHVEITWSRIGIAISTGSPSKETASDKHHQDTVFFGYSNQSTEQQKHESQESLQLRIPNCSVRASSQTDFVLEDNSTGRLLLLREGQDQVEDVQVREAGHLASVSHALGPMAGTGADFVASYDSISVGRLSLSAGMDEGGDEEAGPGVDGEMDKKMTLMLTCLDSGLRVQQVSCGRDHSAFLTCHGSILTCGTGSRGQLGHGSCDDEPMPRVVSAVDGVRCVQVAAGGWHTAAITECGDLWMWGWNDSGQLGLPCPALQSSPAQSTADTAAVPLVQQCTHCQQCLENKKRLRQGEDEQRDEEHSAQDKEDCQHRHDQSTDQQRSTTEPQQRPHHQQHRASHSHGKVTGLASLYPWPQEVEVVGRGREGEEETVVSQVACGSRHTAVITGHGQVLTTGWNKYGQLGLPHTCSVDHFTPVPFADTSLAAAQLWCGPWNTMFVISQP